MILDGLAARTAKSYFWRSFLTAAWLGWQIEANWADPFLFAVYSIIKPLASASILVVMYAVITNGNFSNPVFPYIYLGNAFYLYVGAVMTGVGFAVVDDRERFKTLKYMFISPIDIRLYLLGRGIARFLTGSVAVFVVILFGALFLNVPIVLASVDWLLFAVSLLVGVLMLGLMGLTLASLVLLLPHQSWSVGEAVAGALYLFTGAIFPLEVLPEFLRPIGYALPLTYWLELLRRSLVGSTAQAFPTFSGWSSLQLFGMLCVLTCALLVVGLAVFRYCDWEARERGYIDRTTTY